MSEAKKPPAPANTYWRGDTLWARFVVRGENVRESLRTSDPKVARRRVTAMMEAAKAARHFGEIERPWEIAVAEWAGHIASHIGPKTAARYASSLGMVLPYLTGVPIHAITRQEIDTYIAARKKAGTSNATIRRDLTAVSSVLEFAIDRQWREGNPALDRSKRLKERRDPITLPTSESLAFLLTRCEPHWIALINAARFTGCRLDELRNLEHRDYSPDTATLTIRQGKGNKRRTIDLIPEAVAALSSMPVSKATPRLFHIDGKGLGDISSGFRSKVRWAQNASQKAGAEFARFRFHDLRHLFAVEALQRGMSIYDLQQHLGHVSIKTTEEYLSFLTPEQAKRAKSGAK